MSQPFDPSDFPPKPNRPLEPEIVYNAGSPYEGHREESASRQPLPRYFSFLTLILMILLLLFIIPSMAERIVYMTTRGKERAAAEVARELMREIKDVQQIVPWVVKSVGPSVVGIDTFQAVAAPTGEVILGQTGEGSGVLVDPDGYLLTNYHVIAETKKIVVSLSDGRKLDKVTVIGFDPIIDLAVLKVTAPGNERFMAMPWGDSTAAEVGETVIAIGNPYGLSHTVTSGILSAKERYWSNRSGSRSQEYLQIDAAINPGNSGGPLVNLNGQLIGINTMITHESFSGIGLAIPSNLAKRVYEQIREHGKVSHGWIGIRMRPVLEEEVKKLSLPDTNGIYVSELIPGGAAEKAELRVGDVIVSVNGKKITDMVQFAHTIIMARPETEVTLGVLRDNQQIDIKVVVDQRPAIYSK